MHKVVIILSSAKFHFSKEFELSVIPMENWNICTQASENRGYVEVKVTRVQQHIDNNFFKVWCEAGLHGLCTLHLNNMGWEINDKDGFLHSKEVVKMIEKINRENPVVHVL